MASLGKVVVLYNQLPNSASKDDLDVLPQVEAVSDTLDQMGFDVRSLALSLDDSLFTALPGSGPDLVYNLVESVCSENKWAYLAPALLETLGVRYTGCCAASMFLTTDKIATRIVREAWVMITRCHSRRDAV